MTKLHKIFFLVIFAGLGFAKPLVAGDLSWNAGRQEFTADFKSANLQMVLGRIATLTGWRVLVEPGATNRVSTEFKGLPVSDALRLLLGELDFALLPDAKGSSRLLVYRSDLRKATAVVTGKHSTVIVNELVVRLQPGVDINSLARRLQGTLKGKIAGLNAYRLQFADAEAAEAARELLAENPEIAAVEDNHAISRVPFGRGSEEAPFGPVSLQLKPPPDSGRIVVGLIDSAVQPLGNDLDKFLLPTVKVSGEAALDNRTPSHGTSMAETLLRSLQAATQGSTSVQVLPVDVYGNNPSTSTFEVAEGVVRAVNAGARIINLSLGGEGDSPILRDTIAAVSRQNIPVFAAAGNVPTTLPYYPAAYPEVMAVTALDRDGIAGYANRGDFVSLAAPGMSYIYYNNQAWQVIGTSAASAYVSGLAAGLMEAGNTPEQMEAILNSRFGVQ